MFLCRIRRRRLRNLCRLILRRRFLTTDAMQLLNSKLPYTYRLLAGYCQGTVMMVAYWHARATAPHRWLLVERGAFV